MAIDCRDFKTPGMAMRTGIPPATRRSAAVCPRRWAGSPADPSGTPWASLLSKVGPPDPTYWEAGLPLGLASPVVLYNSSAANFPGGDVGKWIPARPASPLEGSLRWTDWRTSATAPGPPPPSPWRPPRPLAPRCTDQGCVATGMGSGELTPPVSQPFILPHGTSHPNDGELARPLEVAKGPRIVDLF